jgi:hypothetical protein
LTPHAIAIDRALAASRGGERDDRQNGLNRRAQVFNRAFKEARAADPNIKYVDSGGTEGGPRSWRSNGDKSRNLSKEGNREKLFALSEIIE